MSACGSSTPTEEIDMEEGVSVEGEVEVSEEGGGTADVDEDSGEAEVVLSNEFHQYSDTFQKDILMDVRDAIHNTSLAALKSFTMFFDLARMPLDSSWSKSSKIIISSSAISR